MSLNVLPQPAWSQVTKTSDGPGERFRFPVLVVEVDIIEWTSEGRDSIETLGAVGPLRIEIWIPLSTPSTGVGLRRLLAEGKEAT